MRKLAYALTTAVTLMPSAALAQFGSAPALIPVQGLLTDANGTRIDGPTDVTFRIWDAEVGGAVLFEETQQLSVENGLFTAYLGESGSLDLGIFIGGEWLGVTVAQDAEMPRFFLATTPFSAFSQNCDAAAFSFDSDTIDGFDSAEFSLAGHGHDFANLQNIPPDLQDGDQDTTYTPGFGVQIDMANTIHLDSSTVQSEARQACFDNEAELTAVLDDNYAPTHAHPYADINHIHVPPPAPFLDCVTELISITLAPNINSLVNVNCLGGYTLTGGGANAIATGPELSNITIYASIPLNSTTWQCAARNENPTPENMTCRAVCCRLQ